MPKLPRLRSSDPVTDDAPPAGGASGLEVGLSLVVAVLGLGALGFALDKWLGTLPWLMLAGGVCGFAGWMVQIARRH